MVKNWKSLLNIHILKGTRPERIKCILYGRLITITMVTLLASYASWYAEDYLQRELSIPKLIHWLKRKGRFTNALHVGTLEALFNDLRRGVLVKRGQLTRPSFGMPRTFEMSRVPGSLPMAEAPCCPQAQSWALGMCQLLPQS